MKEEKTSRRKTTIVCLTKYKEVVTPFIESINKYCPDYPVIFVLDPSGDIQPEYLAGPRSAVVIGPEKFEMAKCGNLGLRAVPEDSNILYLGDDVRILEPNTIERLEKVAYSDPTIGILSPKIFGRGSPAQVNPPFELSFAKPLEMWFPCVYIKRELIDKIGYLDERFNDFGCDDFDYCVRALQAGYFLAIAGKIAVQHEASPEGGPTTFVKTLGAEKWRQQEGAAQQKVAEKYKLNQSELQKLFNGDISVLSTEKIEVDNSHSGLECDPTNRDEANAFLRKQKLWIATPVYGGDSITVNYVNSLLGLTNLCNNIGIQYKISFMYNESLITRARNKMVYDFRQSDYTHFLFCDCDIGFDPRDIIMLLFQKEEVIGAPCVRKNIRWDRVINAIKKNGKDYTGEELEKITGEFVVNFPHDNTPANINLGRMLEVRHVGTGLMLIKRHVFDKIEETFPENWYLQLYGEVGGRVPMFMFFQAGLDEESRQFNAGGFPDYISEDYAFCMCARKAGVKVWLAPFMKSTHLGNYTFIGDLESVALAGGSLR